MIDSVFIVLNTVAHPHEASVLLVVLLGPDRAVRVGLLADSQQQLVVAVAIRPGGLFFKRRGGFGPFQARSRRTPLKLVQDVQLPLRGPDVPASVLREVLSVLILSVHFHLLSILSPRLNHLPTGFEAKQKTSIVFSFKRV